MAQPTDILQSVLRDSAYRLSLFDAADIADLRERAYRKTAGSDGAGSSSGAAYARCIVRDREIRLTPEEVVRQLYAARLLRHYGYPPSRPSTSPRSPAATSAVSAPRARLIPI